MERLQRLPVPILPTFVGALTLSNVYNGLGYTWIRHIFMWIALCLLVTYLMKIIKYPNVVKNEYNTVVPCSLYAGFTMIMMILGSYFVEYHVVFGKTLFFGGMILHAIHILIFTYKNVIKKRDVKTFVPSWFVTYNGLMVSCTVGAAMQINPILEIVTYYGIMIYFIIIPFMIWRLIKVEMLPAVYHTMAVVLAPCSLCVVSYLNVIEQKNFVFVCFLYICVLLSLLFVIIKLPKFFTFAFMPSFAGMTFPMAIGIVATTKMSAYFASVGHNTLSMMTSQLSGIQLYVTTMIIGYVLLNFIMKALRTTPQ